MNQSNDAKLDAETLTVGKIFQTARFYRVPDYQRPFSWVNDQFRELFDDLVNAPSDKDYFLGTVVLHKSNDGYLDIVDGQQRITSLVILLSCIRDTNVATHDQEIHASICSLLRSTGDKLQDIPARDRLTVRDPETFTKAILNEDATRQERDLDKTNTKVAEHYEMARSIFTTELSKLEETSGSQRIIELARFIVSRCVLVVLSANTFADSYRLFEVVNDRGLQLRRIDILKSYNLSYEAIKEDRLRASAAQKWEEYEERLGGERFQQVFQLLRLIYTCKKPEYDLNREFTEKILGKKNMPSRGSDFIGKLGEAVDLYEELFVDYNYLDGTADEVPFASLMYIMDNHLPAYEWRAVILASAMKNGKRNLMDILEAIEYLSVQQWVEGMRKDERFTTYTEILSRINNQKTKSIDWIKNISYDTQAIRTACCKNNFYGFTAAKYLLARAELSKMELEHKQCISPKSVEHVLPQNPAGDSDWVQNFNEEERAEFTDCAGNLVLLSRSKNSSASRKEFNEKKRTYLQDRVSDYPRSLEVLGESSWTPAVVSKRTKEFAELVTKSIRVNKSKNKSK